MIEWRVCWSASSNITFHGETDWEEADDGETEDEVRERLENQTFDGAKPGPICAAMDAALEASGFEWYVETRESGEEG